MSPGDLGRPRDTYKNNLKAPHARSILGTSKSSGFVLVISADNSEIFVFLLRVV